MALPNNPTPAELVKAVKALEQGGGGGTATDVQVDSTSITSGGVANLKTKNGDYNASTNKLVTEGDVPDISGKADRGFLTNASILDERLPSGIYGVNIATCSGLPSGVSSSAGYSEGMLIKPDINSAEYTGPAIFVAYRDAGGILTFVFDEGGDGWVKMAKDDEVVHLAGAETLTGEKTHQNNIIMGYDGSNGYKLQSIISSNIHDLIYLNDDTVGGQAQSVAVGNINDTLRLYGYEERPKYRGNGQTWKFLALQFDYVKLSSPTTNTTTTTAEKTFNIQTITGDTDTSHVYEIYGLWHLYDTGTNFGWLWSDLWGYSSGSSTLLLNTTSNSRVAQTAFVVPCKCTTTGLKAKLNASADESLIAIFGYRRIQ